MAIVAVKSGRPLLWPKFCALCGQSGALQASALDQFVEALPRNATGKIHKPTLRQQFGAG